MIYNVLCISIIVIVVFVKLCVRSIYGEREKNHITSNLRFAQEIEWQAM